MSHNLNEKDRRDEPLDHKRSCCTHSHNDGQNYDHQNDHDHSGDSELEAMESIEIPDNHQKDVLHIDEMDCPMEGTLIRDKLEKHPDIKQIYFNYLKRECHIVHQGELNEFIEVIEELGMTPIDRKADEQVPKERNWFERYETPRLVIAGLFAAISEAIHFSGWGAEKILVELGSINISNGDLLIAITALISIMLVGLSTYKKGWIAIKNRTLNINALMSVAVTGAVLLGEFPEAAMVMLLFTLSEVIEGKSLSRAQNAISELLSLAPDQSRVIIDGEEQMIAIDQIKPGSIVRLLPGERIPLDGVITRGASAIDESPITGESIPVDKFVDDSVYAGSINQQGEVEFRTLTDASNSTLAKIVNTIEEAQGNRAPVERFIDRFAAIYTPVVFLLAIAIAIFSPSLFDLSIKESIYNALVILIIACPCALVISTPVAVVSSLTSLARYGILVKGGEYIEKAAELKNFAFDKTGTITAGTPRLLNTVYPDPLIKNSVTTLGMSIANRSDHPVSRAIVSEYEGDLLEVDHFEAILGQGTQGVINQKRYYLGNTTLMKAKNILFDQEMKTIEAIEKEGHTVSLFADDDRVLAIFIVSDTLKENSISAIQRLNAMKLNTVLLSGDNNNAVQFIAKHVGIHEAYGGLLPEDKVAHIERLAKEGVTGMIGDGINDAPALAVADIGFAMGAMGSDVAIETANVAIMDDDLGKLPYFVKMAKHTVSIIRQNIIFAIAVKALFFILVLLNMGSMWMAVFADVGTSILVILNGLRLLRMKPKE